MTRRMRHPALAAAIAVLILSGCESLREAVDVIHRPEVRIASTELEDLSFTGLTLRFDVEIRNPNPIGISLSGFDYELQIEDNPFVSGEVAEEIVVEARGRSVVPLPVELGFEELVKTFGELEGREEAAYRLSAGLTFDLPVLGLIRIPVSRTGSVPILYLPGLQVSGLRVETISLSGAALALDLEMSNRNNFKIFIESLEYRFQVDGDEWASGMRRERVRLSENGSALLTIPVELDFTVLGRAAYQMILGGEIMDYTLEANLDVGTSLRALKNASIPFELAGQLRTQH